MNIPCPNVISGCSVSADDPRANISSELRDGPLPPPPPTPPEPGPEPEPEPEPENPIPVQGFLIWLNSEQGLFQDVDGTVPIENGARVLRWEDQSGNGYHVLSVGEIQTGFPSEPLYRTDVTINGYPVLHFNDVSKQKLTSTKLFPESSGRVYVFVVAQWLANASVYGTLWNNDGAGGLMLRENNETGIIMASRDSVTDVTFTSPFIVGQTHLFEMIWSEADELRVGQDGSFVSVPDFAGPSFIAAPYSVGGRVDDVLFSFFPGYMVEVLVYRVPGSNALTAGELSAIRQYFFDKYNIS